MDVFELSASLTLDSQKYNTGLNEAEGKAQGFGGKLKTALKGGAVAFAAVTAGITALSAAFGKGIKDTAEYGDKVDKMSQKIGISSEAYQKWDYVMQRAGGNVNSLKMGMKTLSKQAEENNESFAKLGITQEDLKNLNQEQLFEKTVKGLSEMEAGTERTTLASELLGRAGADMGPLLNEGSQAIEEQMKIAEQYGMIMPEATVKASAAFEDSVTTMQMTLQGMRNRLMGEFLPAVTQVTDGLATLFTGDMSGAEQIEAGIQGVVNKIAEILPKVLEVGGKIVLTLVNAIVQNAPMLAQQAMSLLTTFVLKIVENLPQIVNSGIQILLAIINGLIQAIPKLIEVLPKVIVAIVKTIIDNLPKIIIAGVKLIVALAKGLIQAIPLLIKMAPRIIKALASAIISLVGQLIRAGARLVVGLASGIWSKVQTAVGKIKDVVVGIKDAAVEKIKAFLDVGKNIVEGIWNGISDGFGWIKGKIKEWVGSVKDFFKKLFGIKSPSKWARDEIGLNIAKGMALGIEDGQGEVESAMDGLMPDYDMETSVVSGGLNEALTLSVAGALETAMSELTPALQQGMVDAMEGVKVKLNGRNFGRLTREAVDGAI